MAVLEDLRRAGDDEVLGRDLSQPLGDGCTAAGLLPDAVVDKIRRHQSLLFARVGAIVGASIWLSSKRREIMRPTAEG